VISYCDSQNVYMHKQTIKNNVLNVLKAQNSGVHVSKTSTIKYIGQSGTCGYAVAAKGYIADYVLKGNYVSWQPLRFDDTTNDASYYVDALAESRINLNCDEIDTLIIHSTPDIWCDFINTTAKNTIGYCTWETNKLPYKWVDCINKILNVQVPSNFNKQCFINSGVESSIQVVPHIWHHQVLFPKKDVKIYDFEKKIIPNNKYTFYTIGEFNHRKGIEDLITTFDKLNNVYKDTQLILKLHYKSYNELRKEYCVDKIKKLTNKLGTSIFLILENLNRDQMIGLHSFGDCYVSLNKGEGFGLTIFDAYNFGKKIITTGYGGQIDYLGNDYVGLVNYKLDKVSGMESFSTNYSSDQEWAYPDLEHAYELMKNQL
jgi:glycosyltransferase involved in cell wall biosynthesis